MCIVVFEHIGPRSERILPALRWRPKRALLPNDNRRGPTDRPLTKADRRLTSQGKPSSLQSAKSWFMGPLIAGIPRAFSSHWHGHRESPALPVPSFCMTWFPLSTSFGRRRRNFVARRSISPERRAVRWYQNGMMGRRASELRARRQPLAPTHIGVTTTSIPYCSTSSPRPCA